MDTLLPVPINPIGAGDGDIVKPANDLRGPHQDKAIQFAREYPVGSELTPEDFDKWAQKHGLLNVPFDAPKSSDAWKAHLQRRHELRHKINNAATHPRMLAVGLPCYSIETISGGRWEVLQPHQAIIRDRLPKKVQTLVVTGRRKLRFLRESIDYSSLPVEIRFQVESIDNSIEDFASETDLKSELIQKRICQLRQRVESAQRDGMFKTTNGGVKAFLES